MEPMIVTALGGSIEVLSASALTLVALAGLEMAGLLSWLVGTADAAVRAVTLRLRPSAPAVMPALRANSLGAFVLNSLGMKASQANDNGGGRDKAA